MKQSGYIGWSQQILLYIKTKKGESECHNPIVSLTLGRITVIILPIEKRLKKLICSNCESKELEKIKIASIFEKCLFPLCSTFMPIRQAPSHTSNGLMQAERYPNLGRYIFLIEFY